MKKIIVVGIAFALALTCVFRIIQQEARAHFESQEPEPMWETILGALTFAAIIAILWICA